jgi:hypothetical protein
LDGNRSINIKISMAQTLPYKRLNQVRFPEDNKKYKNKKENKKKKKYTCNNNVSKYRTEPP